MLAVRTLSIASLFVLVCLFLPGAALASSTKCLCNDGSIAISMDDGDGVCDDACEDFGGGGRVWTPADAQDEDGSGAAQVDSSGQIRRDERRESVGR